MKMTMKALLALVAGLAVLTTPARAQSKGSAKTFTHTVYVAVSDQKGAPVLDLGPTDFEISEGENPCAVTRAALASDPMRIALLIDTSEATNKALTDIRAGALAFLDALPPEHEVLLVSTGRQVRVHVPPTTDRKKLRDSANSLFSDGGGTVLMDGLLEIDGRFMRKVERRWPVYVIVTGDGTEISAGAHEREFNNWTLGLAQRGVSAHAMVIKVSGSGVPEIMAMNVTQNADGRYDMMNTTTSLPEKMRTLAAQIGRDAGQMRTRYAVEFQTGAADLKPIKVAVPRSGVTLRMSFQRGVK